MRLTDIIHNRLFSMPRVDYCLKLAEMLVLEDRSDVLLMGSTQAGLAQSNISLRESRLYQKEVNYHSSLSK